MRVWLLIFTLACSTHYMPQRPGHVAVTMQTGQLEYVRDGKSYPHGFLGAGLEDAVAGNPAAMSAAHEYRYRQKTGLLAILLGTVAEIGGAVWLGVDAENHRDVSLPLAAILGGLTAVMFGTCYIASAEPYRWDAINMFNDTEPGLPPGAIQARLPKRDTMLSFPP